MIHLDTSFLIRALLAGSPQEARLLAWLSGDEVRLSTVAWAEFLCGPMDEDAVSLARTVVGEPIPLLPATAERGAALFNAGRRGRGSMMDCLIAATAIEAGAALATANPRDFVRFLGMGLRVVS